MSRLAILALTLTALPWSGDSFVSTIASSSTTITEFNLPPLHTTGDCHQRSSQRSIGRPQTRQQRQQQQPALEPHPTFSSPTISSVISYQRSSSLLSAALLNDSGGGGRGQRQNSADNKDLGWHRRILGKISWRRQSRGRRGGSESSSSLPSSAIQHREGKTSIVESFVRYQEANQDGSDDFVARNFDSMNPEAILPVVQVEQMSSTRSHITSPEVDPKVHRRSKPPQLDSEYFDVSITPAASNIGAVKDASSAQENVTASTAPNNSKRGLICRLLENILLERIGQRWTAETPESLRVDIRSSPYKYNNIGRLLFKGLFRADATLSSDRIVFPMIRFSSVRLQMEQVTLNLLGFFSNNNDDGNGNDNQIQHQRQRNNQRQGNQRQPGKQSNTASTSNKDNGNIRWPNQFDLHIEDLTMTRHDLLFSSCVKNGLRQLLINVLKDRGVRSNSIRITSIDILRNGKISCIGEAKMHFPSAPVHFEVRSGISFSNRGHVLTFPGLEVSLNRDIGLFVPVHPTLDLDVGHNTKFRSIIIDGHKKLLKIAASVTITPDRTRVMQDYVQTSEAFSAIFFYDIGQWLTRLLRFSK